MAITFLGSLFGIFFGSTVLLMLYKAWRALKCRWERDAEKSPKCALCGHQTLVDEQGRELDDEFVVGDYECPECGYSPAWSDREEVGELVEALEKLDGVRIQFADIAYRVSIWTPSRQKSGGPMGFDTGGQFQNEEQLLNDAWGDIKRTQQEYPEAFEVPVEGAPSAALMVEKFERADTGYSSTDLFVEHFMVTADFRWRALETKAVFECILEGLREEIRRRVEGDSRGEAERTSSSESRREGSLQAVELPEAPTVDIPILGSLERALRR